MDLEVSDTVEEYIFLKFCKKNHLFMNADDQLELNRFTKELNESSSLEAADSIFKTFLEPFKVTQANNGKLEVRLRSDNSLIEAHTLLKREETTGVEAFKGGSVTQAIMEVKDAKSKFHSSDNQPGNSSQAQPDSSYKGKGTEHQRNDDDMDVD